MSWHCYALGNEGDTCPRAPEIEESTASSILPVYATISSILGHTGCVGCIIASFMSTQAVDLAESVH